MARGVEIGRGYIAVDTEDGPARAALKSFTSFAADAFKAAAVAAGAVTLAAAKVGIEFNSMKEQAEVAFTTLLGSGDKAKALLSDLQKFSAQTPFEMKGLIENARGLLGVGVAADKVIPTLTALGNAAGALGLNQEAFNRIMLATTQSMAKGKIQGEELLQFAENGIPIFDLLGKALGVPKDQIADLASKGKLLAADVLPKLFDQMQKDYGGAMAAQSKTLAGTWSSLKDNAKILAGTGFKPLFDEAKRVTAALGDFAASDKAAAFAEQFAEKLDLAISATKVFANEVRLSLGGEMSSTLQTAKIRAEQYFETFKTVGSNALKGLGDVIVRLQPVIKTFFDTFGLAVVPGLEAVSKVSESFARNADGIGRALATAMNVVLTVAQPALALLGAALTAAAAVLSMVMDLINAMPSAVGAMVGVLATAVIAWRALGGSIATVTTALTAFSSSGVIAGGLKALGSKIDNVALSAGVMAERFLGSSKAGGALVSTGTAMSGALGGVASVLPAIGGALLAITPILATYLIQQQNISDGAEKMARALAEGGKAAQEQAREYGNLQKQLADLKLRQQELIDAEAKNPPQFVDPATGGELQKVNEAIAALEPRVTSVGTKFRELTASMSPVQKAQAEYNRAVAEFGPNSAQAAAASATWRQALADEKLKNEQAANAVKSHIDKLLELQATQLGILNTEIGYRQALNQQELAQQRVNQAYTEFGPKSQQYRDAMLQNEQAIAGLIDAAGRHAAAQHQSEGAEAANSAAMNAQTLEALRLASVMGDTAPESLKRFISGLTGTQLAAAGVTVKVNEAGHAVAVLPDGKTVVLSGNNADALAKLAAVQNYKLYDKAISIVATIHTIAAQAAGAIAPTRDIGGAMQTNRPYLVHQDEIIFADRGQYVATAAQARRIAEGMSGGGAGLTVQQTINPQPGMSEQHVADLAASGIAFRVRYS